MCMYAHVCVCIECTSVCMCLRDSRRGGRRCGRPVGGARRGTCPIGRQDRAALCCRSPVFNANGEWASVSGGRWSVGRSDLAELGVEAVDGELDGVFFFAILPLEALKGAHKSECDGKRTLQGRQEISKVVAV